MPHSVTLLFDIKNTDWPTSDDIALELATHLNNNNVEATFLIAAQRAKLLAQRERSDVIATLLAHDIGFYSNTTLSHQPINNALSDVSWDESILSIYDKESEGLEIIKQVFGVKPSCWGQINGSWGAQINGALYRLNIPAIIYPSTRTQAAIDVHWYSSLLTFPSQAIFSFDSVLTDDQTFEKAFKSFKVMLDDRIFNGTQWTGVFVCHPSHLRAIEFWDVLDFATESTPIPHQTPPLRTENAYQTALKNFNILINHLKQDYRIQLSTIQQLQSTFSPPAKTIYLTEIDEALWKMGGWDDVPTDFYRFSAAELLDLMTRVYNEGDPNLETLQRRVVFGPADEPPHYTPPHEVIYWSDFIVACRSVANYVTRYQRLPSNVFLRYVEWSIGAFYRAAVTIWPQFRAGQPPNYIEWQPAYIYPAIGQEIAATVQEGYEKQLSNDSNLDLNNLLMHTCFQSWTLRRAYK